ncbi:MAG: hypothetical protein WB392_03885 [Methanotrichaceae archaeon]
MDTKISLIGLAIIIMLAIGITSGDTVDYSNCKVLAITTYPPSTIGYVFESDQFAPETNGVPNMFSITFDGSKNANYQQEMANLLRDACFSGQSVDISVEGTEIVQVFCSPSSSSSATATELRRTVATGGLASKINNPTNVVKLLNNTNSIGVTKFLNPQPLPPGISRGGNSVS